MAEFVCMRGREKRIACEPFGKAKGKCHENNVPTYIYMFVCRQNLLSVEQ